MKKGILIFLVLVFSFGIAGCEWNLSKRIKDIEDVMPYSSSYRGQTLATTCFVKEKIAENGIDGDTIMARLKSVVGYKYPITEIVKTRCSSCGSTSCSSASSKTHIIEEEVWPEDLQGQINDLYNYLGIERVYVDEQEIEAHYELRQKEAKE